jgi:hypothetical protein
MHGVNLISPSGSAPRWGRKPVGYELRRMIRAGAPRWWTPLQRLIATEIADDARDPSPDKPLPEGQWPWSAIPITRRERNGAWRDGLAELCGVGPSAISHALTKMAQGEPGTGRDSYDMRQPIMGSDGKPVRDKRGRTQYSASDNAVRFWVPPLPPRPAPKAGSSHQGASKEGYLHQDASKSSQDRASKEGGSSHQDASIDGQSSHEDASMLAPGCKPFPPLSPQPSSPSEIQSPQAPVLAGVASAEASPAGAEGVPVDEGAGRCRYAGCRTPGKPVGTGNDYHPPCRDLAGVRARQDQRGAGEAAA